MLVIGSAAGVAFMGMEKVDFFWYLRKVCAPILWKLQFQFTNGKFHY